MKKIVLFFCALLFTFPAMALDTKAKQAILIDDTTGTVLFEKNADELMHPSSMTKLMTLYIAFQRLKNGSLKLTDEFPVSEKAWRMQGSKMFVPIGDFIKVEDLIRGIAIQSGNDACIVLAEGLAGSEAKFAEEMNRVGKEIGLKNSNFLNATGWPDDNHLMTARDLMTLAQRIIHDFPEQYHYFSELEFVYHGIRQGNRNLLLTRNIGVDGLKTGHTEIGGYGITASAKDAAGRRLIVVVNGLADDKERANEAELLLRAGFRDFETITLAKKGQKITDADVWFGVTTTVPLLAAEDVVLTVPRLDKKQIKIMLRYNGPVPAPVKPGQEIGVLEITLPNVAPVQVKLLAGAGVEKLSPLARVIPALSHYLFD